MTRVGIVLACVGLLGCGARTELTVTPPPVDAGTDAPPVVGVLPCFWTLGDRAPIPLVGSHASFQTAVHGLANEAVLLDSPQAVIVSIRAPPATVEVVRDLGEMGEVYGAPSGYATILHRVELRDADFAVTSEAMVPFARSYSTQGQSLARITKTAAGASSSIHEIDLEHLTTRTLPIGVMDARNTVEVASGGHLVTYRSDGESTGLAFLSAGGALTQRDDVYERGSQVWLAPDRVRGAAVAVVRDVPEWRVETVAPDLSTTPLATLGPGNILGSPVTTQAELVVVRDDGVVLALPLDGGTAQTLSLEPNLDLAQVTFRPGTSIGGVFYSLRDGDDVTTFFRSLICNR